jgi:hypothetical protein
VLGAAVLAGCGGGGSSTGVVVQPARFYQLSDFQPASPAKPGVPTTVSFVIRQPDGTPMTQFKTGSGPHTGVHLIIVRRDLSSIIHLHPDVSSLGADGVIKAQVTFPAPGPYRTVVDVYPATGAQPNFQLFHPLAVAGAYHPEPLPKPSRVAVTDGYRFVIAKVVPPVLKAIQAGYMVVHVTGPTGKPAVFTPWYGALAHAIFFRQGSLDYFHTHVCSPDISGCTAVLGGTKVTGTSTTPGKLTVGVLVPAPGTWKLFLQCQVDGHVVTAPFTLVVH